MKKLFTITCFLFIFPMLCTAQAYIFTTGSSTYTELSGGTPVAAKTGQTDTLPLGFYLMLNGNPSNTLYLYSSFGYVWTTDISKSFSFFGAELIGGSYSYTVEGSGGNRIFKLQGKNAGFGHDFSQADFVNFQLWLYENGSVLEVHIGPSSITNADWDYYFGNGGPSIGCKGFRLKGNTTNPTVTASDTVVYLSGTPKNGKWYRFVPILESVAAIRPEMLNAYPNPADGLLNISNTGPSGQLSVTDVAGKCLLSQAVAEGTTSLDTRHWPAGVYFISIASGSAVSRQKIAVVH